ncbi:permease [Oceanirhabdus sp. W0125-5]|uniref:permease n=1 Tax=Oceanirhabdus sp. W0125-5 TaxID=2999116 RepID=UPI0022F31B81|nr:permease [Oceanirhabdus sp. W0125-5]WBW97357.1 permease [Oceanirhabdus sp. W0125-5]
MERKIFWDKVIKVLLIFLVIMIIYFLIELSIIIINGKDIFKLIYFDNGAINSFIMIFMSIIMEGFPFILLGSFISSLIHLFVSEKTIKRILPQKNILGIMVAGLLGIIFPVCECAIVPIVRRLIKKGLPIHIAITFMISVPIVNPIVMVSTYYAFSNISTAILRSGMGYLCACIIGIIILILGDKKALKQKKITKGNMIKKKKVVFSHSYDCSCSHCNEELNSNEKSVKPKIRQTSIKSMFVEIVHHTNEELKTIGKYFTIGALLSAMFQVIISRDVITMVGGNTVISISIMLALAFMLSLCSEADAFIAKTFASSFTSGSVMAFMILGPMIDLKNTLILSSSFKGKFIAKLIFIIFSVVFILGCIINLFGGVLL